MLDKLITFLQKEAVLCIAFLCACASLFMVGDLQHIPESIDWRVIMLLFCLMASVAGLKHNGLLTHIACMIVKGKKQKRVICFALVAATFFTSMLVTNDVALLAFVPIAILALEAAGWRHTLPRIIVLQTIAANLGGMITPVGNPQNLFIFTTYNLNLSDFLVALLPFGLLAFVLLALACLSFGKERAEIDINIHEKKIDRRKVIMHALLFVASIFAVLKIIPCEIIVIVVIGILALFDRPLFLQIDYPLLATFICFFIFSGNMSHLPQMQDFLGGLMNDHPMLTSLITSQIISNVPAAVLLSEFTSNWHSLLIGVDLGGLGTPIASLASLIAFKIYMHTVDAKAGRFLAEFSILNIAVLLVMIALYILLHVSL